MCPVPPHLRYMREEARQMAEAGRIAARAERRDRFAMAALTGFLSHPDSEGEHKFFAEEAYRMADAMEAEREKGLEQ